MDAVLAELAKLSIPEKLLLVEDLWDSIASSPEALPIPDWQKEELAKREANYQEDPGSATAWEVVKRRIRAQHD